MINDQQTQAEKTIENDDSMEAHDTYINTDKEANSIFRQYLVTDSKSIWIAKANDSYITSFP